MACNFDNLIEYFTEDNDSYSEEETPKNQKHKKISSCHERMDVPILDSKDDSNLYKTNDNQENSLLSENNNQQINENEQKENFNQNNNDENEQCDDFETKKINYQRLFSFRPKPNPPTPKITIKESCNENNLKNLNLNNKNENEFTEIIKTKIEGEENNNINCLKLYPNKNEDDDESFESSKNTREKQNIVQSFKVNNLNNLYKKNDIDSEKEEEEKFLRNEEERIKQMQKNELKKNISENKNENNNDNNQVYLFKDPKDEEEDQLKNLKDQNEKNKLVKAKQDINKKLTLMEKIKINKEKVQNIISHKSESLQEISEESISNKNLPKVKQIITSNNNTEENNKYKKEISLNDNTYEKQNNEIKINNDNEEKLICNLDSGMVTTNNSKNRNSNKNIENHKDNYNKIKQKIKNNYSLNDKNIKYNMNLKKVSKTNNNNIKKYSSTPDNNLIKLIKPQNKRYMNKNNTITNTNKNTKNAKNHYSQEYSFRPKINKKSELICIKKNINNSDSNKKNLLGSFLSVSSSPKYNYINCRTENSPTFNSLYENALVQREKINKLRYEELDNIKRNMNKIKTNKKSNTLIYKSITKNISKIVNKYQKNDQISIINTIQILYELNILHELLRDCNCEIQENNMQELIMQKVSQNNVKAQEAVEEIDFVEQLWVKLNPNKSNQYINKQKFIDVLKLLYSFKNYSNDEDKIITIKEYLNENENNKYNNNFDIEVWTIEKLIKVFMALKSRNKNYKNIKKEKIISKNNKEEEILAINPEFNKTMEYYYRNKKNNKYLKNCSRDYRALTNRDFDRIYANFMYKLETHEKNLQKLREQKKIKEIKKCYKIPKINKTKKRQVKNSPDTSNICPRYEYLYKLNDEMLSQKEKKIIEKEKKYKDKEKYLFKPRILTRNKSFVFTRNKKPKGFEKYVERTRSFIKKKELEKIEDENKRFGKNYDKIMAAKISFPKYKESSTNEKRAKKDEEVFFNIDVKIGNETRPLKIFKGDDVTQKVNNFCQIYKIGYNEKKKILTKIKDFNSLFQNMKLDANDKL